LGTEKMPYIGKRRGYTGGEGWLVGAENGTGEGSDPESTYVKLDEVGGKTRTQAAALQTGAQGQVSKGRDGKHAPYH